MSGKAYNGEKAVISLTSWKKRIGTVGITLFSLLRQCPGFHIVLVLSEEEFPKKEDELPHDLIALVKTNKVEILWIYPNLMAFKKWLPTALRYTDIPIISADDDCVYTCNYAQMLYNLYDKTHANVCTCSTCECRGYTFACGAASLYKFTKPELIYTYKLLKPSVIKLLHDDVFIGIINTLMKHTYAELGMKYTALCQCCMEVEPLSALYGNIRDTIDQMLYQITSNS